MNVQLVDSHDRRCFKMYTSEYVWDRWWEHARPFAGSAGTPPTQDFELAPSSLAEVVRGLEADLIAGKQEARPVAEPIAPAHVEILGDVLDLDLRNESHARLQRLAALHKAASRLVAEQATIRVLFVPPLAASRYYLAALFKRESQGGMSRDQARAALMQDYERLRTSEPVTEELRAIWTRDRAALEDDRVMQELLDYLTSSGLVQESPTGTFAATPKLRAIAL